MAVSDLGTPMIRIGLRLPKLPKQSGRRPETHRAVESQSLLALSYGDLVAPQARRVYGMAAGLREIRSCFAAEKSFNVRDFAGISWLPRSDEHTSELQSRLHLVCRLLLEKKKKTQNNCTIVNMI